jgi:TRAP-type uncharacterized transport system fused permease subunit
VPFMFFYSHALLMQGAWHEILHVFVTAGLGIYLLSASVQGWFFGHLGALPRIVLLLGALAMIQGGWMSDIIGLTVGAAILAYQKRIVSPRTLARGTD